MWFEGVSIIFEFGFDLGDGLDDEFIVMDFDVEESFFEE